MRTPVGIASAFLLGIALGRRSFDPPSLSSRIVGPVEAAHLRWFNAHFVRATSLRVGMTRAELGRIYEVDGGVQPIPADRFVDRDMPFKVRVEFAYARPGTRDADGRVVQPTDPRDRIVKLSPIYLETRFYD